MVTVTERCTSLLDVFKSFGLVSELKLFMRMEALNLTRDEVNRLSEALQNDTFRQLLREYVEEMSNPDTRTQYEEDIKQLEADRGMQVHFIHPEAHHVIKTNSAGGKCFINVCSDPLIDKPSCEAARDEHGHSGQNWTLPYSLTPGTPDTDSSVTYDVIFHPDALHMATENQRFMNLINSTAMKGIEDSFHIKLDSSQMKVLKSKYKGVPHPAVIRKPIPGFIKHKHSKCEENLSFPYPDVLTPSPDQTLQSSLPKQPIKPHYTLKYRSVVDLQNYTYSGNSMSTPRPKDIIVIMDLPLLTSARDVEVNVMEKRLVLESKKPSYKLDLLLSYPVDEDKGEAKFNKTTKQLTLILPVLPVKNSISPQMTCDDEEERENGELRSHQDEEKPQETQHTEFNSDIQTQSKSDGCVPEINPDDEENHPDMNIHPHATSVSNINMDTHVTPDEEFKKRAQKTTLEATAAFTHEPLMSRDAKNISQHSVTDREEPQNSSELTKPVSHTPETREKPNSALNHDTTVMLNKETEVQLNKPADVDNTFISHSAILREAKADRRELIICDHQTSATLCFQNSLCFDLD